MPRKAGSPASNHPDDKSAAPLFAEASVAAIWSMAQCEVLSGSGGHLGEAIPEMAFILLVPIVGARAAEEAIHSELATAKR